jgi:radical SAM superfamily enzyme YgiQ (UPF0313 family)
MGGVYPSFIPQEALKHADAVVIGEADLVIDKLLDDLVHGSMRLRRDIVILAFAIGGFLSALAAFGLQPQSLRLGLPLLYLLQIGYLNDRRRRSDAWKAPPEPARDLCRRNRSCSPALA